jgi:hypothetical protein
MGPLHADTRHLIEKSAGKIALAIDRHAEAVVLAAKINANAQATSIGDGPIYKSDGSRFPRGGFQKDAL